MYCCIEKERLLQMYEDLQEAEKAVLKNDVVTAERHITFLKIMLETEMKFGEVSVPPSVVQASWLGSNNLGRLSL